MDLTTSRCWAEIDLQALRITAARCMNWSRRLPPDEYFESGCLWTRRGSRSPRTGTGFSRGLAGCGLSFRGTGAAKRRDLPGDLDSGIYAAGSGADPGGAAHHAGPSLSPLHQPPGRLRPQRRCPGPLPCQAGYRHDTHRLSLLRHSRSSALEDAAAAYQMPELRVNGIFTHFSSSYGHTPEDDAYTQSQFDRFLSVCQALERRGISPGLRHCCNSPAAVNSPAYALDMCRVGTVLYGLLPESAMLLPPFPSAPS